MCAILDTNVRDQVFGSNRTQAGRVFFKWINTGKGHLVVGGKLLAELRKNSESFNRWAKVAISYGRMSIEDDESIRIQTKKLQVEALCRSNDHHIIALAQISGTRLLFSNDQKLRQDFKDPKLINKPKGKIYASNKHKHLLADHHLCRFRKRAHDTRNVHRKMGHF